MTRTCRERDVVCADKAYRDRSGAVIVAQLLRCNECGWTTSRRGASADAGSDHWAATQATNHVTNARRARGRSRR